MTKLMNPKSIVRLGVITLVLAASLGLSGFASAATPATTTKTPATLQIVISKGDQEIARRLTTLTMLTGKINNASKLSATDKVTLSNEVASTITGLTDLKSTLDADTTLTSAHTDAQNIFLEYRVYALVYPKVDIVKDADDEQVAEGKLINLAQTLQTRITADQQAGKDVTSVSAQLADMKSKIAAAQAISSSEEVTVIPLQPNDYNSNHQILSGDFAQLKAANADNKAADADAKAIVTTLKSL